MKVIYKHYRIPQSKQLPDRSNPALLQNLCMRWYKDGRGFGGGRIPQPHGRGGVTECLVVDPQSKLVIAGGAAYCSTQDNFEYSKGREIALRRAMVDLRVRHDAITSVVSSLPDLQEQK